ncbi:PREDICTED: uncharacterized protein LOC109192723 [Ipomoea nil]|uniref:uncharacterized protein LOC109192723 n=1 Tax=Ipomoea nil TaxID=35883 RepID=UPI00090198A0|nr:PREDICTED: uncharacterized protein LOC109192723 [Ipomoea nil]
MLHAFLNEFKVEWSKIIFNNIVHTITFHRKSLGDIAKKLGYGFVISHLLAAKGVVLRPGIRPGQKACHMKQKPSGYDKQKALELGIPIEQVKAKRKSRTPRVSEDEQPKPKRQRREKHSSRSKAKKGEESSAVPISPKSPQKKNDPIPPSPLPESIIVKDSSEDEDNLILSKIIKSNHFRSPVKAKSFPKKSSTPKEATPKEGDTKDALSEGEGQPKDVLPEKIPDDQEPKSDLDETAVVQVQPPIIPKPSAPAPEVKVPQPSPDQLLRESIERDYKRVQQWQKWRTAPLRIFLESFEAMQDEEDFALAWIGTDDLSKALRIEEINRVFSYKMTNRTLGKDKAPICIELNKPPLDPVYEEELKQLRYAMLLSNIKTTLEKEHQNDPNYNVSGTKDELGREIEEGESDEGAQETEPEDSHTILIGPDYDTYPQRSPLRRLPSDSEDSKEASTTHPEDLSRAIVPHIQPIDETPIKHGNERMCEGKLEASPIPLSSDSGGNREAPPQDDHMNASPTNIEEESPAKSPRTIMNIMRGTVHSAETIHRQYLALREKDTKVMDDLCKKVDFLIAAQSKPRSPPQAQPQSQQQNQSDHKVLERMTKKLYDLEASLNKVARQQHEIKHSHFGLKEREHEELVRTNPIKVFRAKINEKIDFNRMLRRQKEKDDQELKEAERQKSKLLEM